MKHGKRLLCVLLVLTILSGVDVFAGTETPIVRPTATVSGVSLLLDGEIGLVYHFYVPSRYAAGYVETYTYEGSEKTGVIRTTLSDCPKDKDLLYTATYRLSAIELSKKVCITIFASDGTALCAEVSRSAEEYVTALLGGTSKAGEKEKEIARTLINYGHYAQLACSATAGWEIGKDYPETSAVDSLKNTASVFDDEKFGIAWITAPEEFEHLYLSLNLDYKTGLRLYIPVTDQPRKVTAENVTETEKSGESRIIALEARKSERKADTYEVRLDGLSALDLSDRWEITIDGAKVSLCALSYARLGFAHQADEKVMNALIALYEFNQATEAYLTK